MDKLLTAARDRTLRLIGSWFAIFIALYAATVLIATAGIAALTLLSPGDGGLPNALGWFVFLLVMVLLYSLIAAAIFSVLAIPFLMLQRFIVSPRPPYLQPGYAAVMFYGPALLALFDGGWDPDTWKFAAVYEAVALMATLLYVRLGRHLDLFPPEPEAPTPRANIATA
jgi:hypothetical protein